MSLKGSIISRESFTFFSLVIARAIDDVMRMEGLNNLTDPELSSVLFARGFDPSGLSRNEQLQHLQDWVSFSLISFTYCS